MYRVNPCAMIGIALIATAADVRAFEVFPYDDGGETLYLKWGSNQAGTPGGTITWSVMPAGTSGNSAYCNSACPGFSSTELQFEIAPGAGFAPREISSLEPEIRRVLEAWSRVTGIRFVKLESDSGAAVNDPAASPPLAGHIRFGVFQFSSGGAAVGYAPPPNGGTGAGDVLLNAGAFFQIAPASEGEVFDTQFAPNDFETLLMHEIGHAIGLAHPSFDGSCPVMQINLACAGIVNRVPDSDDIDGARFLYGHLFEDGFESLIVGQ